MLTIRSPIDGRIVASNVQERFGLEPTRESRRGSLLEIADPTKEWELEVLMPEKRTGHIAEARLKTKGKLPVTFFLATNPAEQMQGEVDIEELSAEVRGESGNTVLVHVSFDQRGSYTKGRRQAKNRLTLATAKIHCGKRAIGYVWFHDLVDFVRAKIQQ